MTEPDLTPDDATTARNEVEAELSQHVRELLQQQAQLQVTDLMWLTKTRALAQRRIPKDLYNKIPESCWRFRPWGNRVLVLPTPTIRQIGSIALPHENMQAAPQRSSAGWIIGVGDRVLEDLSARELAQKAPVRYNEPLALVGEFVTYHPISGTTRALSFNILDETNRRRTGAPLVVLATVGDLFGAVPYVLPSDWSEIQDSPILDSTGSLVQS